MILTRSADYALRALIYLAQRPPNAPVPLEEIAQSQFVPPFLLSKILQSLVKVGVVRSKRGFGGGFVLVAKPDELTLEEVIKHIDGPFTVFECLVDEDFCQLCSECVLRDKFHQLQEAMIGILRSTTITDCIPPSGQRLPPGAIAKQPGRT